MNSFWYNLLNNSCISIKNVQIKNIRKDEIITAGLKDKEKYNMKYDINITYLYYIILGFTYAFLPKGKKGIKQLIAAINNIIVNYNNIIVFK